MDKLKEPTKNTENLFSYDMGKYMIGYFIDNPFFILSTILKLMYDPNIKGEEILKKEYGEKKFKTIIKFLDKTYEKIKFAKIYYDGMNPKTIIKEEIKSEKFVKLQESIKKLSIKTYITLWKIYHTIIAETTLKDKIIYSGILASLRRSYRNFELDESKKFKKKEEEEAEEYEDY